MSGVPIQACNLCGAKNFPPHLRCAECGGSDWQELDCPSGEVVAVTILRRRPGGGQGDPVHIALVRTDLGPVIVARAHEDVTEGTKVALACDGLVPIIPPA